MKHLFKSQPEKFFSYLIGLKTDRLPQSCLASKDIMLKSMLKLLSLSSKAIVW